MKIDKRNNEQQQLNPALCLTPGTTKDGLLRRCGEVWKFNPNAVIHNPIQPIYPVADTQCMEHRPSEVRATRVIFDYRNKYAPVLDSIQVVVVVDLLASTTNKKQQNLLNEFSLYMIHI
uniref:Uncharacterized protein n=1 Tax=Glossina palpalis gambiensis TaxID=67801 RepID=A0A1B0BRD8_9MUSC